MNRTGSEATATALVIAGRSIDIDTAVAKTHGYPAVTVTRYDLPGPGPAAVITADEIARTHKVRSRISHAQRDWFIRTAVDAPWAPVPIEAQLVDADPNLGGELYDHAEALYEHFRTAAPRHVGLAKISKVLHPQTPRIVPHPRLEGHGVLPAPRSCRSCPISPPRQAKDVLGSHPRRRVHQPRQRCPPAVPPPPGAVRDRAGTPDREPDRCASARPADLGCRLKSESGRYQLLCRVADCKVMRSRSYAVDQPEWQDRSSKRRSAT